MTRLGRKPQGSELVDTLVGSQHAKARLKAFLETLSGEFIKLNQMQTNR